MVLPDSDYAAFKNLYRLKPIPRQLEPVISPEAKKELENRKKKFIANQEAQLYNDMVKNVAQREHFKEDEYGQIWKEMNKQGTVVLNTVLTVGGAFTFAYYGVPMMVPSVDLPFRVISGLILGVIVFIADLYFIMKNM